MDKMTAFGVVESEKYQNLFDEPILNIWLGRSKRSVWNPDSYFNNNYIADWFSDDLVREMVQDVDLTEVISYKLAYDWQGDPMNTLEISGGVKTLIMMYKIPHFLANGDSMGDNCAKWLELISKRVNCTMTLSHCMKFGAGRLDARPFHARFLNNMAVTKVYGDYYANLALLWDEQGEMPDDIYPFVGQS